MLPRQMSYFPREYTVSALLYSVYQKNFTLWNLSYLQAIVLIWQLWMPRINDPQKHKILYKWN